MKQWHFVGRQSEMEVINRLWQSDAAKFLVLYGRRRVGKTRLLTEWTKAHLDRTIFWIADQDSQESHLRQFSQVVYRFAFPNAPIPDTFTFASWDQAWAQVAELARNERLAVIIDEFTYLMESNSAIASQLQRTWDTLLENTNLMLVISGSHLGMIHRGVISAQAPLYGRASAILNLLPLPFGVTGRYFPDYSAEERVKLYAVFGGIPHYWRMVEPNKPVLQNVQDILLSPDSQLHGESKILLSDFVNDPHNYVAILRAIAHGYATPSEIEKFTGIAKTSVSQYLSNLMETGFISKRIPVTAGENSRLGRHAITDPYLRFFYRFIASRLTQFAMNQRGQAVKELERHLVDFIGTHTWEEICREWTLIASNQDILPVYPDQVDSTWTKEAQVDVVGINTMEKTLILGECKWTKERAKAETLRSLVDEKTGLVIPSNGNWRVYYLGFSKEGWTEHAMEYAQQVERELPTGRNWQTAGIRLVDLPEVDADLQDWQG
jgi:AAA+ ATPase superfamily predicted ATPase